MHEGQVLRIVTGDGLAIALQVKLDADDPGSGALPSYGSGHRAISATDIEHSLARRDPVDEELMIVGQSMLRMFSAAIGHGALIDDQIELVLELQQAVQGPPRVCRIWIRA
jgi:hypothetical protein